jgi:hypothetical protein
LSDHLFLSANGLELSCPAEAGKTPFVFAHPGGPSARAYAPARRVRFSELLGSSRNHARSAGS